MIDILKKSIKNIISFLRHPILLPVLFCKMNKKGYLILGKHLNIRIRDTNNISLGNNIEICDYARILCINKYKGQSYQPRINLGSNIFIGYNFSLLAAAPIMIEDFVLIASNVLITSENHGMNPIITDSYSQTPLIAKPVHIKEGCWLGEKSMIMPGVTLGKRCIVAAGAVVTKSFPDYCLLAGVPAKCIKKFNHITQEWESNKAN